MVKVYPGNSLCGSFYPLFLLFRLQVQVDWFKRANEKQERRRGPGQRGPRGLRGERPRAREIARPFLLLFSCLAILAADRVFTTVQRQREALLSTQIFLHIYIHKESSTHGGLELNIFLIQGILAICAGCRKNRKRNDGKEQGAIKDQGAPLPFQAQHKNTNKEYNW